MNHQQQVQGMPPFMKRERQRVSLLRACVRQVSPGESLLIAGASGAGKTSTLRAIAGLWSAGSGVIRRRGRPVSAGSGGSGDIFFVPQVGFVSMHESCGAPSRVTALASCCSLTHGSITYRGTPLYAAQGFCRLRSSP